MTELRITYQPDTTPEWEEFITDIFTTACEGGINYWADFQSYRHSHDPLAEVIDVEHPDSKSDHPLIYRITLETIALGLQRIAEAPAPYWEPNYAKTQCAAVPYLTKGVHDTIIQAVINLDAGELDAWDADSVVQAGLFGKIVYG